MSLSFRNLSIRKKLTALMMLISVLILSLVSGLYVVEEVYSSRTALDREMSTLGLTLGASCKKLLLLRQLDTSEEILASLRMQPNIRAAYLFDEDGTPVSQYLDSTDMQFVLNVLPQDFPDSEGRFWAALSERKVTSSWQHFGLFLPIKHDGRQVGSIYIMSDLRDLYGRLSGVFFVVLLTLGLLVFLSWWLAGSLQRPVSAPLLSLVDTMGSISQRQDYSLRAQKSGQDEIGLLVDGFNRMLEQIEANRQELVEYQHSLEVKVDKRTAELSEIVAVLELAKQQAEAASEAKSQFLANITHELRTPLIGVLGMNELMFRTAMDEQQQMLATTVQNSGEDLLSLINNVLDFSKIEAGKLQLEECEFALYRVVDEVLNLLAGPAAEKGLSLYSRIPLAATSRVLGDEVRVRQILMNLVGNAIKFTEQGSVTINLDYSCPEPDVAAFSIEVSDTGIGMNEAAQQQIFSAFYQADDSHTRKYGGTGLGLAIVQQLVQLFEGSLELESAIGKGSCFRFGFTLPLVAGSEIELPESLQLQPVLVYVTDSIWQQQLVQRLQQLGVKVVAADSATDAWRLLSTAERSRQPFQLAFFSADTLLPDQQLLYLSIRSEKKLAGLRRILLLEQAQSLESAKQEHQLFLPISWDRLHETICQSWHELHLVEKVPVSAENAAKPLAGFRLLLAGGNIASRELIKLALIELPIGFEIVSNLSQFHETAQSSCCDAILLDTVNSSQEQLQDFCQQRGDTPLFLLCSSADDVSALLPLVSGKIVKPFKREFLMPLLQPLLDAKSASRQIHNVDGGGSA